MQFLKSFWNDESGAVVSAETVMVGSVGVLGVVTGLSAVSNAVDGELREFAFAIRSLDQSYSFAGHRSATAYSAGSCYSQASVAASTADLGAVSEMARGAALKAEPCGERGAAGIAPSSSAVIENSPHANDLPAANK